MNGAGNTKFTERTAWFSILLLIVADSCIAEGLKPWAPNRWYWSYQGEPVLLLGASDDDNLFQWPKAELVPQLDRLVEHGGNLVRCTMSDRQDRGGEVYAFGKHSSGKYDLSTWNEEYWQRFRDFLAETSRRGVIVQIEIWDRFDYTDHRSPNWQNHPYHPVNNVNYTAEESGFAETYPEHPGRNQQPFFFTTPSQANNQVVLQYQQRFVERLLDIALAYDNVLYCIDNETTADEEWARYWAQFIRDHAARKNTEVMVTEMWDSWDLRADHHRRTFDHPELYDYVDVSQNTHNSGRKNRENLSYVRDYLSSNPRPMNTTKVYGADANKFGDSGHHAIERFWSHLLGGAASIRFHRPPSGLGLSEPAVACLESARKLESRVRMWDVEPADHLVRAEDTNSIFVAAKEGVAYAVFVPGKKSLSIDLRNATGDWRIEWIDVGEADWLSPAKVQGGNWVDIVPPIDAAVVAVMTPWSTID